MLLGTNVGRTKFKSTAQAKENISWINQSLAQEREDVAFNSQRNLPPCERAAGSQAVLQNKQEIVSAWPSHGKPVGL